MWYDEVNCDLFSLCRTGYPRVDLVYMCQTLSLSSLEVLMNA